MDVIYIWLKEKQLGFAAKENRACRTSDEEWIHDFIFSDLHEQFFVEFPIILSEWMLKLKDTKGSWSINVIEESMPEKIKKLKEISNPISRVVNF